MISVACLLCTCHVTVFKRCFQFESHLNCSLEASFCYHVVQHALHALTVHAVPCELLILAKPCTASVMIVKRTNVLFVSVVDD